MITLIMMMTMMMMMIPGKISKIITVEEITRYHRSSRLKENK